MATININKKANDPFYRYKMPRIIAKVEGRGNGIKTVVVNMSDISKALQVPTAYPTKFLGIELGAQVILDPKNDRYIISGSHESVKLQKVLYDFIDKYVLCPSCENPETVMGVIKQKEKIKLTCKACGAVSIIEHSHKLNTYVIKNPPSNKEEKSGQNGHNKSVQGELDSSGAEVCQGETIWLTDTSDAAVEQRMAALTKRAAELVMNSDLEKTIEERLNILEGFCKDKIVSDTTDSIQAIEHEIKRLDLEEEALIPIANLIFKDEDMCQHIKDHRKLLISLCRTHKNQVYFLGAIESILYQHQEWITKHLYYVWQELYDADIVEEDPFLSWFSNKSIKFIKDSDLLAQIHKFVHPFIDWLLTAEEESGEDDVEVEFVSSKVEQRKVEPVTKIEVPPTQDDDEDEDINIDDI